MDYLSQTGFCSPVCSKVGLSCCFSHFFSAINKAVNHIFIYIFQYNNIILHCVFLDDGKTSRLTRSLHALQSQLCPEGSSSERCFYSQLSMFMRMQDSLMDPVALRNIGKRSSIHDGSVPSTTKNDKDFLDVGLHEMTNHQTAKAALPSIPQFNSMLNVLKSISRNGEASPKGNTFEWEKEFDNPADQMKYINTISEPFQLSQKMFDLTSKGHGSDDIGNFQDYKNTDRTGKEALEPLMDTYVSKRQIICPPGVSRLNCYDNAFAFYMRLLKTLKNH